MLVFNGQDRKWLKNWNHPPESNRRPTDYEFYTGKNPTYSSRLQRGNLGVADRIFQPLKAIVGVIPDYKRNALLHWLRGIYK